MMQRRAGGRLRRCVPTWVLGPVCGGRCARLTAYALASSSCEEVLRAQREGTRATAGANATGARGFFGAHLTDLTRQVVGDFFAAPALLRHAEAQVLYLSHIASKASSAQATPDETSGGGGLTARLTTATLQGGSLLSHPLWPSLTAMKTMMWCRRMS